jgi:biopolymer transport protein ExbD
MRKSSPALDIGPMLDVVLQILIFFMLSSTFMSPKIKLALPEADSSDGPTLTDAVVVTASADGSLYVNDRVTGVSGLAAALRQALAQSTDNVVTLRGDERVPYKTIVAVIDASRKAGAASLDMAHGFKEQGTDGP